MKPLDLQRKSTKSAKPKGKHLTLVCGHEIDWPRPVTATGRVWCHACDDLRKIASVK